MMRMMDGSPLATRSLGGGDIASKRSAAGAPDFSSLGHVVPAATVIRRLSAVVTVLAGAIGCGVDEMGRLGAAGGGVDATDTGGAGCPTGRVSFSMSMTRRSGNWLCTPIAEGSPKPIVPRPLLESQVRGLLNL